MVKIIALLLALTASTALAQFGYGPKTVSYLVAVKAGSSTRLDANAALRADKLISGIYSLALWGSLIEGWDQRHNAGTSTVLYGLKVAWDATLLNTPTWGADGITYTRTSSTGASTAFSLSGTADLSVFVVHNTDDDGGGSGGNICLFGTLAAGTPTTTVMIGYADAGSNNLSSNLTLGTLPSLARPAGWMSSMHVLEPSTTIVRVAANGGSYTSTTQGGTALGGTQPSFRIGQLGTSGAGTRSFNGTMALMLVFTGSLTADQNAALNTLAKRVYPDLLP